MIDITKKYRTRDAKWPVTIVSTDGPYPGFPVVGYAHHSGTPLLCHWSEDGRYPANTHLDLIEVREPREFWINIYDGLGYAIHQTEQGARTAREHVKNAETVQVREILDQLTP